MSPLLQTIENVPDGVMDIAKGHRSKNRYLNIHTCGSSNSVVCGPAAGSQTCGYCSAGLHFCKLVCIFCCVFLELLLCMLHINYMNSKNCSRATQVAIIQNGNAGRFNPKVFVNCRVQGDLGDHLVLCS